jgi:hypothetical protein
MLYDVIGFVRATIKRLSLAFLIVKNKNIGKRIYFSNFLNGYLNIVIFSSEFVASQK